MQGSDTMSQEQRDTERQSAAPGDLIVFDLRALTRYEDAGPAVTVLSDTGDACTVLLALKAGQGLEEHQTSSQILVQVLRGQISFTARGAMVPAHAGTLLQLESGVPHSLDALTNAVVLLILTPSPANHGQEPELFRGGSPLVSRAL
jgi:quercetin dioxygenase-like cupin family protein